MNIDLRINRMLFNDVYFPYLQDYSHRYEIYYGGAGSGKSVFVAQKLLVKAIQRKRRVLVIRKWAARIEESVFTELVDLLQSWKIYEYCKVTKSPYKIVLPNGSAFLFKGMDDSEKVKSITGITDIWIEEATDISQDEFTQLDLRLRALVDDLQIFCSFNPVSKANWVYKKWFAPDAVYDKQQTFILHTTYKDNRFLPITYGIVLEQKINTDPRYYKIYVLGEFGTFEGLVFSNWQKQEFDHMKLAQTLEHRCGMDLGWVDKTAIIDTLYDRTNKTIYVFNEFYKSGQQLSDIVKAIEDMQLKRAKIRVDSAEPRSIQYFRNNGIDATAAQKGQDSVKAGLMFLQDNMIVVHPRCENFILELENFSYVKSKQTGEYTEETTHEWSHAIDACRYAYSDIYTNKQLKSISKSAFGL